VVKNFITVNAISKANRGNHSMYLIPTLTANFIIMATWINRLIVYKVFSKHLQAFSALTLLVGR